VGQLIRKSGARVVPVFFAGQNSAWFQTASQISQHLRVAFIFHEVRRRMGTQLNMVVGKPLVFEDLQAHLLPKNFARHLQIHVARLRQYLPSQTHDLV
jgi:putative hemolysin